MKLKIGKQYKTRAGGRAVVVDYDAQADGYLAWHKSDERIRYHNADGSDFGADGKQSPHDLMSDWVEPRTGWINIFEIQDGQLATNSFITRQEAEDFAATYTDRIACVQWTEGQGLGKAGE